QKCQTTLHADQNKRPMRQLKRPRLSKLPPMPPSLQCVTSTAQAPVKGLLSKAPEYRKQKNRKFAKNHQKTSDKHFIDLK
ncbi:MAG: hypothetical protein AB3N15_03365, partial [Paracoccaceae bacterium]